ncbi:MAG: hypothetical protein DRZ82_04285 [Thermoprotei archaeon]|mgnify:CR=1 FL=1|nr:MAG: hypothetical protein DRZ82_04285 [Thermoprotei archaeon]
MSRRALILPVIDIAIALIIMIAGILVISEYWEICLTKRRSEEVYNRLAFAYTILRRVVRNKDFMKNIVIFITTGDRHYLARSHEMLIKTIPSHMAEIAVVNQEGEMIGSYGSVNGQYVQVKYIIWVYNGGWEQYVLILKIT